MEKKLTIKQWEKSERPREKFIEKGAEGLTNTELIAIIIGSGRKNRNAIDIARELLGCCGNSLRSLWQKSYEDHMWEHGIGETKAISLAAIGELIKRTNSETPDRKERIFSATQAVEIMEPLLKDLKHEECWILHLNSGNKVLAKEKITSGGVNSTILDAKLIVKSAMSKLACAIILFHNHPGGDASPSTADMTQTKKLHEALRSCDIKLLDHIIITPDSYYSFANMGHL